MIINLNRNEKFHIFSVLLVSSGLHKKLEKRNRKRMEYELNNLKENVNKYPVFDPPPSPSTITQRPTIQIQNPRSKNIGIHLENSVVECNRLTTNVSQFFYYYDLFLFFYFIYKHTSRM